jgi:hypothetical protein
LLAVHRGDMGFPVVHFSDCESHEPVLVCQT